MSKGLALALALAAAVPGAGRDRDEHPRGPQHREDRSSGRSEREGFGSEERDDDWSRASCTVEAYVLDARGREREARLVSAARVAAVAFRGKVSSKDREGAPAPLVFDVYNPRGQRYQMLLAQPRVTITERDGRRFKRTSTAREARLAVAGSSIAWTSMYGRWRVVPRVEGDASPCGQAEYFTIRP